MTQEEFFALLVAKGKEAKKKRDEVVLKVCLLCGNSKWNLECNTSIGAYHCWACGGHGHLSRLVSDVFGVRAVFGVGGRRRPPPVFKPDAAEPRLQDLSPAMRQLFERRGLGPEEITRYGIKAGLDPSQPEYFLRAFFPLKEYWSRRLVGQLGRSLDGRKPKYLFTGSDKEIVGYRYPGVKVHVVVEGVIDGIKVHQAGYNAAVLLGTMNAHIHEWSALVPPSHWIVLMLDGDASEEAQRLYWEILPIHEKIKVCSLPEHIDPGMLTPRILTRALHTVFIDNPVHS